MEVTCPVCDSGIASDGGTCGVCGGDALIDLTDEGFKHFTVGRWPLTGVVWSTLLTDIAANSTKLDAIDTKFDAIDTKLDAIDTKLDALESLIEEL